MRSDAAGVTDTWFYYVRESGKGVEICFQHQKLNYELPMICPGQRVWPGVCGGLPEDVTDAFLGQAAGWTANQVDIYYAAVYICFVFFYLRDFIRSVLVLIPVLCLFYLVEILRVFFLLFNSNISCSWIIWIYYHQIIEGRSTLGSVTCTLVLLVRLYFRDAYVSCPLYFQEKCQLSFYPSSFLLIFNFQTYALIRLFRHPSSRKFNKTLSAGRPIRLPGFRLGQPIFQLW